jgi:crotonobetaine/carnitine-CoA ligase
MDDMTVLGSLARSVEAFPDKELVKFIGSGGRSSEEVWDTAGMAASAFVSLGVKPGDRVIIMISNRFEFIDSVFACAFIGAVFVPINTSMRGPILEHMLRDADPALLVIEDEFVDVVDKALDSLRIAPNMLVVGEAADAGRLPYTEVVSAQGVAQPHAVSRYANSCILYTSGTTGPSKGVLHTQSSIVEFGGKAQWLFEYTADDISHNCLPLYHANALCVTLLSSVRAGAKSVFARRFSASGFWSDVREEGATVSSILGAMVPILWGAEPSPNDLNNDVRVVLSVPTPPAEFYDRFERRFGLRIVSQYGMSDTSMVIGTPPDQPGRPGYAGVASKDFECVVADENDFPVPDGTPGELLVRPLRPHVMMTGYWNNPVATSEAFRNLWFHTGDVLARDPDGWFKFIDRKKDAIRRFGENISSFEVETVIAMHPSVAEVAVYAVPSELSEDEVMAAIVLHDGAVGDLEAIGKHADDLLPYFASPRYLLRLDALPKTQNEKVRKELLRSWGITSETLDRGRRGKKKKKQ